MFCEMCGSLLEFRRQPGKNGKKMPYCPKCGFLGKETIDQEAFRLKKTVEHHPKDFTMVIDPTKDIERLKKEIGDPVRGFACPKCYSFYITSSIVVTRGDEPGKRFFHCLVCGYTFKKGKWIDKTKISPKKAKK